MTKRLMLGAAMLALAALPAHAQKDVKIGFVTTFTGPQAVVGNDLRDAFALALDHLGRLSWLESELADWQDDLEQFERGERWLRLGGISNLSPRSLAIVRELFQWRDAEAQRAAKDFEARARQLTGEIPPLISQYTNRFMRWFRVALMLSFIVLMAWFIYTFFVQKSFFDWIGDRIDNLTDDRNASALPADPREAVLLVSH